MIDCRAIVAHTTLAFRRDNAFVADVEEPWSRVAYVDETFNAEAYSICAVPIQVENVMRTKANCNLSLSAGERKSHSRKRPSCWGRPLARLGSLYGDCSSNQTRYL